MQDHAERRFHRDQLGSLAAHPHPQALLMARLRRLPISKGDLQQMWAQFCFLLPNLQPDVVEFTESRILQAWDRFVRQERCFREGLYRQGGVS